MVMFTPFHLCRVTLKEAASKNSVKLLSGGADATELIIRCFNLQLFAAVLGRLTLVHFTGARLAVEEEAGRTLATLAVVGQERKWTFTRSAAISFHRRTPRNIDGRFRQAAALSIRLVAGVAGALIRSSIFHFLVSLSAVPHRLGNANRRRRPDIALVEVLVYPAQALIATPFVLALSALVGAGHHRPITSGLSVLLAANVKQLTLAVLCFEGALDAVAAVGGAVGTQPGHLVCLAGGHFWKTSGEKNKK